MSTLGIGSRIKHPAYGDGVVVKINKAAYLVCFILYGLKDVGRNYDKWEIIELIEPDDEDSFSEFEKKLIHILHKFNGLTEDVDLADKWDGGMLLLQPADANLKAKEMPIDTFFHKIVMVRDRVRVMEQRINSSNLNDEEKVNLQQYITKIYGSLTSFNVLFKFKDDYFVGDKKD